MQTVEQVGGKIRNSIAKATANGWAIVRNYTRGPSNAKKSCCAVGSVVVDIPDSVPLYGTISERLGVDLNTVIAIARGFDGAPYDPEMSLHTWHFLGETIYKELSENLL